MRPSLATDPSGWLDSLRAELRGRDGGHVEVQLTGHRPLARVPTPAGAAERHRTCLDLEHPVYLLTVRGLHGLTLVAAGRTPDEAAEDALARWPGASWPEA